MSSSRRLAGQSSATLAMTLAIYDAVGFVGLDHGVDRGGTLAARLGAGEQPVAATNGNAAPGTRGDVVADLEASIIEEAAQRRQRLMP